MEKRNRVPMRLVKPSYYWRSRRSWQPGQTVLDESELKVNGLMLDDQTVNEIRDYANGMIKRMLGQ